MPGTLLRDKRDREAARTEGLLPAKASALGGLQGTVAPVCSPREWEPAQEILPSHPDPGTASPSPHTPTPKLFASSNLPDMASPRDEGVRMILGPRSGVSCGLARGEGCPASLRAKPAHGGTRNVWEGSQGCSQDRQSGSAQPPALPSH